MCLALSICVLFISLIQSVNGAQFLSFTCILVLPSSVSNAATVIVPHTSIIIITQAWS